MTLKGNGETNGTNRQSLDDRPPVEDYYPGYVDPDEVEFDHCFWKCPCGWHSRPLQHPSMAEYHRDGHHDFGRSLDCGLGKCVMVFEDGSTAEVAV